MRVEDYIHALRRRSYRQRLSPVSYSAWFIELSCTCGTEQRKVYVYRKHKLAGRQHAYATWVYDVRTRRKWQLPFIRTV